MKTTKGGKVMNPTDAYRKELRKKELKRNKKERKKVREVGILKKDPETLRDQIDKLEMMKADGALDKARKHKKRQLEDTLNLVLKKRKEYVEKTREKGDAPMFSHLGLPVAKRSVDEDERVKHPKPEDSVYYHPTLNPTGAPPPGKPPMFKSTIGPRNPMPGSGDASTSMTTESEDVEFSVPAPPPPPMPNTSNLNSLDGSIVPQSLPLPPPPPIPIKPDVVPTLPHQVLPPPPPGPPPKENVDLHSSQPPHPTTTAGSDGDKNNPADDVAPKESSSLGHTMLPPPPPPPGLPLKLGVSQSEGAINPPGTELPSKMMHQLPPPPPRIQQGHLAGPSFPADIFPPGISRFPPPPPLLTPNPTMVPLIQGPHYGFPPPMMLMRPPVPPGPPPLPPHMAHDATTRPAGPQKPSYIKSAAATVTKRPLAQHTPELTAMVPASVRVRREGAVPKPKPKASSLVAAAPSPSLSVKPGSIDDSYTAFLEDMKALGALND